MAKSWRLILDDKLCGPYAMAVDEVLLLSYEATRVPSMRIYGWRPPYISLGYNQDPRVVLRNACGLDFVRRLTGGAAILHDREITYSLCCSREDLGLSSRVKESYRQICRFLIEFYRSLGLSACFAEEERLSGTLGNYGNFCFSSCEHFDLMISGRKIGGNAQRRRRDVIFQHGSIPQTIDFDLVHRCINDEYAGPDVACGLDDFFDEPTDFTDLQKKLAGAFQRTFGITCTPSVLSADESAYARRLEVIKYSSQAWNHFRENIPGSEARA